MGDWMMSKREGIYVYIWLVHFIVQQKLAQHCKSIILHKQKDEMSPANDALLVGIIIMINP